MILRDLLPEIIRLTSAIGCDHITITRGTSADPMHRTQIRFIPDRHSETGCRVERRYWEHMAPAGTGMEFGLSPSGFRSFWEHDAFTIDDVMAVDWTMDERG